MLKKFTHLALIVIILVSSQKIVTASGYQVVLQGNRNTGMGNMGVGLRPDASSMFFNPGAMSFVEGNSAMIGISLINSNVEYWDSETQNSTYTARTDNPLGTPFHVYVVWGPKESPWKFGLGAYTPFGSGVQWGSEWKGKYLLDNISLQAIYTQATASYKINDKISIGAGFVANFGSVSLTRVMPVNTGGDPAKINLEGASSTGFGYNLGLLWAFSEKWQLGLNYRSRIDAKVEGGDVTFENLPSSLSGVFVDNKFNATLPMPSNSSIGITYLPTDKWEIGVEFDYVGWSVYESLSFDFIDENPALEDTESPRNYEDSWVVHLGGEYKLSSLQIRAGGYYDKSPVLEGYMTPETPDSDRVGLTAGLGYSLGEKFQFDLSFLYIMGTERSQSIATSQSVGTYPSTTDDTYAVEPGTYKMRTYIPGISIAYKF